MPAAWNVREALADEEVERGLVVRERGGHGFGHLALGLRRARTTEQGASCCGAKR